MPVFGVQYRNAQQLLFKCTVETPKRSENSEIMIKFTDLEGFPVQFQVRFESISFRPNAEPNLAFRFSLLNLNPNAASGLGSVQQQIIVVTPQIQRKNNVLSSWRIIITGTGTGGTAFLSGTVPPISSITAVLMGQGDYYFQYRQEGPVNAQDSDQNLVDADDGWATSPIKDNPSNPLNGQERVPHQQVDPSCLDATSSLQMDGSKPVRLVCRPVKKDGWLQALILPAKCWRCWILINQQPHSDIHAQREVMIEYRRISTAQGSSGIKWFQGWTSHQVTLGG
ncbi:hypothetical protein B0H14DRAFT_2640438 [Mycena olivaceomarginata]|nr:hypothetical protein B0H14DRAFT_2640438 [Mycena olivaceomarginata]